jgi:hypothetical protein
MAHSTSNGFNNNFPINTFSNYPTAPTDYNRINLVRNGCSIYQVNGGGRDTYIYNNNGGFCKPKEAMKYGKPGHMITNQANSKDRFP